MPSIRQLVQHYAPLWTLCALLQTVPVFLGPPADISFVFRMRISCLQVCMQRYCTLYRNPTLGWPVDTKGRKFLTLSNGIIRCTHASAARYKLKSNAMRQNWLSNCIKRRYKTEQMNVRAGPKPQWYMELGTLWEAVVESKLRILAGFSGSHPWKQSQVLLPWPLHSPSVQKKEHSFIPRLWSHL